MVFIRIFKNLHIPQQVIFGRGDELMVIEDLLYRANFLFQILGTYQAMGILMLFAECIHDFDLNVYIQRNPSKNLVYCIKRRS